MRLRFAGLWLLLLCIATVVSACDPLAPDPTTVVVIQTATFTPGAVLVVEPTFTLTPSITPTPRATNTPPPTLTPTPTMTPTPFICNEQQGQVIDLRAASEIAGQNVLYRVYLPPCYSETGKRYPLVMLMHGSDRDYMQWTDLLNVNTVLDRGISLGALPPMILIMPNGGGLANSNVNWSSDSWEDVVLKDLLPDVERNFCTWNERAGRAIGGISRGGFWAFSIGLRHPDLFSAIAGHSAFFDPKHIDPPFDRRYNPLRLAQSVAFEAGQTPRFWLDVGKDDYARDMIEAFRDVLAERDLDPGYTLYPTGDHNNDYWKSHIPEYLSFYGARWPRTVADLPSCLQ